MEKLRKKLVSILLICLIFTNQVYASDAPYELPEEDGRGDINDIVIDKPMVITADDAVSYGLTHNLKLQSINTQIDLARIKYDSAQENADDLADAKERLKDAEHKLNENKRDLRVAQNKLNTAYGLLDDGIAPSEIPLKDSEGHYIRDAQGNPIILPAGTNILKALLGIGLDETTAKAMKAAIVKAVKASLSQSQDKIDQNEIALSEATTTLEIKWEEFNTVVDNASDTIGSMINYSSNVKMNIDDAGDMMVTMAGVNLDVTRYARGIYRNQIAMLISKNYYDALYDKYIVDLKTLALERGKTQYDLVKLSYENGMKAKDDYLLSQMYYESTQLALTLAESNYQNALTELKRNMNLPQEQEIVLVDELQSVPAEYDLQDGLKSGLTNRIEIQKSLGQLAICELNQTIMEEMYSYRRTHKEVDEANYLVNAATLELETNKASITADILQSYELVTSTAKMLDDSKDLIPQAEEVVMISQLKYEQGFGQENSLLKNLNLESSSGTIVELIAAQEKLAEVEANVANIRYNYTMARLKYLNDSGILIY